MFVLCIWLSHTIIAMGTLSCHLEAFLILDLVILLQFYLSTGGCKYGKSCKFSHGRGKTAVTPVVEYNFLGLPIRPVLLICNLYCIQDSFILCSSSWCILFDYILLYYREKKNALTTCVMAPANMGQIVGLIILILLQ